MPKAKTLRPVIKIPKSNGSPNNAIRRLDMMHDMMQGKPVSNAGYTISRAGEMNQNTAHNVLNALRTGRAFNSNTNTVYEDFETAMSGSNNRGGNVLDNDGNPVTLNFGSMYKDFTAPGKSAYVPRKNRDIYGNFANDDTASIANDNANARTLSLDNIDSEIDEELSVKGGRRSRKTHKRKRNSRKTHRRKRSGRKRGSK